MKCLLWNGKLAELFVLVISTYFRRVATFSSYFFFLLFSSVSRVTKVKESNTPSKKTEVSDIKLS